VAHSVTHPNDLRELSDADLHKELVESRQILEQELKTSIHYFTYPTGFYDERVSNMVTKAGYRAALTMDDLNEGFANDSDNLLAIKRFGQSALPQVISAASGGPHLARWTSGFDFMAPIVVERPTIDNIPLILISGGKPITIHAKSRYQVPEIIADSPAIAAVDGGFFSLEYLDSNVMIGPVLSQNTKKFIPGKAWEGPRLKGRPLVLIGPEKVRYVPFDHTRHNTLKGIQTEMPEVTDAFVAAAWLVKDGQPRSRESFGTLFDFDAERHRAYWGINQSGQPVVGVTVDPVGSVSLGEILAQANLRDAVMVDSGASTSLAYKGESLVGYEPRPVPHVVGLVPAPGTETAALQTCVANAK
jgi:poly-beta-1,6-N-acetyl-D-glucosamine N-deacetylase